MPISAHPQVVFALAIVTGVASQIASAQGRAAAAEQVKRGEYLVGRSRIRTWRLSLLASCP